ncbi:two-component system response regulator [Desulfocicer niacini]
MRNDKTVTPTATRILVIDDDPADRMLLRACLEKHGYHVVDADNGKSAMSQFETLKPNVVLLDVLMPQMDGFDTCRVIRKHPEGKHIPVLMVTGLDDTDSIHQAFDAGATDFITKPINWNLINYHIKYVLRASDAFYDVINQQKQIQKLVLFDHLTGLANRTMFRESLGQALDDCSEDKALLGVLFMDIDRFKIINDTLGHKTGDALLQMVADRIRSCARESDCFSRSKKRYARGFVARLGGDEFTIILPRLKAPEDAGRVAERIQRFFSQPFVIDDNEVFVSVSIGISLSPIDGSTAETLMKHADVAMYHAKENGKNCFQFYEKSLNIRAREKFEFENDVRKAVLNKEFMLYYQPQVSMADGSVSGAEALTRWCHYRYGMVSPAKFIASIEELGLIIPFTDWLIKQAGIQHRQWHKAGMDALRIAVNISSRQFVQQKIPEKFLETLNLNKLCPSAFELELTESVLARQNAETLGILKELKQMGLTISVDDFGTGYSSLVYLKTFPIDIVKIDRFFVKDILTSSQDAAIVKAIIAMAHTMGIKVVAEGIEKKEQFDLLREMGCDYGQGFLFSPAVSSEKFLKMVLGKEVLFNAF